MLNGAWVVAIPTCAVLLGIFLNRQDSAALRSELSALRVELKTEMAQLRSDLTRDMMQLRSDLTRDMMQLHQDMVSLHERVAVVETKQRS